MTEDPDAYTPKQLAERLPFTVEYIRDLCITGELPAFQQGRKWLIPKNAYLDWLARRASKRDDAGVSPPRRR